MRLGLPGPLSVSFCGEVDFRMCLGAGLWTPTGHRAAISVYTRRSAFAYCSSDQDAIANPGCAADMQRRKHPRLLKLRSGKSIEK